MKPHNDNGSPAQTIGLLIVALSVLLSGSVFAFSTASYFPLADNASWTYQVQDNVGTTQQTNTIAPGTILVNGVNAKVMNLSTGDQNYYTNDANGIRQHRSVSSVPGVGVITLTLSPPEILATANATLSTPVTTNSTVSVNAPGVGNSSLPFTSTVTPVGFETVAVPAGTFTALRVVETVSASGTLFGSPFNLNVTTNYWMVSGVGVVKAIDVDNTDGTTTTATLTFSNLIDGTPDAFSFAPQYDVPANALITANAVVISGITIPVPVSISGGQYSINGGAYTSAAGTVNNGDSVTVQLTSAATSAASGATSIATLTVGGVSASFQTTTNFVAPPANALSIYFISQPGDYIGGGQTRLISSADPGMTGVVTGGNNTRAILSSISNGILWDLHLAGPSNAQLAPGQYAGAQRWTGAALGTPALDLSGESRGCNMLTGRFQVLEAQYDSGGVPQVFAADFEQHCEGQTPALFGQVRYNSTVPFNFNSTKVGPPGPKARGDFNADGGSDILWRNTNGTNAIWFMNGATVTSAALIPTVPGSWTIVGSADFNGDGKSDILWRGPGGELAIWLMNGANLAGAAVVATIPMNWTVAATGDFNGDGKGDILWRGPNGEVAIWLMNGTSLVSGTVVVNIPNTWGIIGTGDFNGDGKADILWRGPNGEVAIWTMNGATLTAGAVVATIPTAWKLAGAADFNGDGKADIFWRGPNGEVAIWIMNGTSLVSGAVVATVPAGWAIVGSADFNGDGNADILWRGPNGEVAIWLMNGAGLISGTVISTIPASWKILGL